MIIITIIIITIIIYLYSAFSARFKGAVYKN